MSGICAILRLDDGPPDGIAAMADRLQRRGPEGTHLFHDGSCALGHTLLATTPEALVEQLPLTHAESGCAITADARIDNRDDLLAAFGLTSTGRVVGDAELILRSYLRWGADCPRHLLGDYAFAIWDPRTRSLFAARDAMGLRQLIFAHVPGRVFACATGAEAVLMAGGVPRAINEGRLADALETYLEAIDTRETFFRDVWRLPPAHSLTVDGRGLRIRRYWLPEPGPFLSLPSDAAYAEAFRDVLDRAVARRLRAPDGLMGTMLSGGMDSGLMTALAARQKQQAGAAPIPSFSGRGPSPETCPETRAILQALDGIAHIEPTVLDWGDLGPLMPRLVAALDQVDEPFDTHMNLNRALFMAAADRGVSVVLMGIGGDLVLNAGPQARWLIHRGRFRQAWREASGLARHYGAPWTARGFLIDSLRQALIPDWLRALRRRRLSSRWGHPTGALLSQAGADRVGLADRVARHTAQAGIGPLSYQPERARKLLHASMTVGIERYDRVSGALGVECRDPYLDREVIDFCLRLPPMQLQRDGWPKWVQRQAAAGLLPDSVRWKRGRDHVGWEFSDIVYCNRLQTGDSRPIRPSAGQGSANSCRKTLETLVIDPLLTRQDDSESRSVEAEVAVIAAFADRLDVFIPTCGD